MAIPAQPSQFYVTQGNGQIALQWNIEAGATSYQIQRSTDGVIFANLAAPVANSYLDTTVVLGTLYYYQVASINGSGTSIFTAPQSAVPTPTGEMSLSQLRQAAQQRADMINSQFISKTEWTSYINQAMFELYDLLITSYEDYFVATPISFPCDGQTYLYALPNGSNTFLNPNNQTFTPDPFYKLLGVDLALNNASNAYVTINKFNFIDRNRFVYPNTSSTIYGVFNLQYRIMGNNIEFIPTPSGGQIIRIWYIPRLKQLLQENDITTIGYSGWLEYVIVRAAKFAMDKEESDTSRLTEELVFLKQRIEETAVNRDAGQPDKISDVRANGWGNGNGGFGQNGAIGGWIIALPYFFSNNSAHTAIANIIKLPQLSLSYITFGVFLSYFGYLVSCKLSSWITFSFIRNFISKSSSAFFGHIKHIIKLSAKKEMFRSYASRIIAGMTNINNFIYRAFKKHVGPSISESSKFSNLESTSPIFIQSTHPYPTTFGLLNLFKKLFNRMTSIFVHNNNLLTLNKEVK